MAVVIVTGDLSKKDFQLALQDYKSYIKITVNIKTGITALGGEYHADAEKILIEKGSKQEDIWGGGFNIETKAFEANALINLRPGQNDSLEILDSLIRQRFIDLAKKVLKDYV